VKVISYLNMHRARLGYVNCVLMTADMQLDTAASLRRRLDGILFESVVFRESSEFSEFASHIDSRSWTELDAMTARRVQRKSQRHRHGVLPAGFQSQQEHLGDPSQDNYPRGDLWLFQRQMRSRLGHILPEDSDEPIELAKDLGMLSTGYALTEFGNLLKCFLLKRFGEPPPLAAQPNPLDVFPSIEERVLYLYALMDADAVFPSMVENVASGGPINKSLAGALENLLRASEDSVRLDEVNELKNLSNLRQRIAKDPVDKAQRVPRLEYMVDLGLLDRATEGTKAESQYVVTDATRRFADAFRELSHTPAKISVWLDNHFFAAASSAFNIPAMPPSGEITTLSYFVRGAGVLGKRTGFIPGRMASLAGAVLALMDGYRVEVSDLYRCAYSLPKTVWAPYVKFSGGSRLDNEFLVSIDPGLERELKAERDKSGPA
jgi:hypothetical protein